MSRRLRSAVELVSHIGELGFDLYHHDEKEIASAVKMLREVNPEMFAWLVQALQAQPVADACCSPSSVPLSDAHAKKGFRSL